MKQYWRASEMCSLLVISVILLGSIGCIRTSEAESDGSHGQPLFITPYLENGEWMEARTASRVSFIVENDTVESFAGFFTVNKEFNSNLYFWFFPAENHSSTAPLVLWLQGGPGSSSLYGTLAENGPFFITDKYTLSRRPYYWTREMNVLYIDNPVGAGFSFTSKEAGYATNEDDVGNGLYSALTQFYQLFPELTENEFFITGDSYAGKYITTIAHIVHERNVGAEIKMNLVGLAIGNGCLDPRNMMVYSDYLYQHGLIDDNALIQVKSIEQNIVKLIDANMFHDASIEGQKLRGLFFNLSGPVSIYDYTSTMNSPSDDIKIRKFVNEPEVRKNLHVGQLPFNDGSTVAIYLFDDLMKSVVDRFEKLLDQYRVMLYNGQLDILIAYPLTINIVKKLKWSGATEYAKAPRGQWYVENELAGYAKTVGNFTEVLVRDAGHLAVQDQPKWTLDLITRFTQNIPLYKLT